MPVGLILSLWRIWVPLLLVGALYVAHRIDVDQEVRKERQSWQQRIAAQKIELDALKARQQEVTEKVVTEYVDRIKVVKEKGDEVVRLVPLLIHGDDLLSPGFRVLHDAAASGVVPASTEGAIAAAAPVEVAAVATTIAENYETAHACRTQLIALQNWAKGVSE